MPLPVVARLIVVFLLAFPAWWLATWLSEIAQVLDWLGPQGMCDTGCEGAPHPMLTASRITLALLAIIYVAVGLWWARDARPKRDSSPPA